MLTISNPHVPFSQLGLPEIFLYHLAVSIVLEPLNARAASSKELLAVMKLIWNQQQLTIADLGDFGRLADRLKPHLLMHFEPKPFSPFGIRPSRRGRKATA